LFKRIRVSTGSGDTLLKLMRSAPEVVLSRKGFVCRGNALKGFIGGGCRLSCEALEGAYQLNVDPSGAGDYFFPFLQDRASYCDVPKNAPDGTLVVTYGMNGCALEVHDAGKANRFLHDSDGRALDSPGRRQAKCRITADMYEGPGAVAHGRSLAFANSVDWDHDRPQWNSTCYEHTLISVKSGNEWNVYQTAVVRKNQVIGGMLTDKEAYEHVLKGPPLHVGVFGDA